MWSELVSTFHWADAGVGAESETAATAKAAPAERVFARRGILNRESKGWGVRVRFGRVLLLPVCV